METQTVSRSKKRLSTSDVDEVVPESDSEKPKRRKKKPNDRRRLKEDLEHSDTWFRKAIADDLWMPRKTELESILKPTDPRRNQTHSRRRYHKHWLKGKPGKQWKRLVRGCQRPERSKRDRQRVPEGQRSIEPLLTSWFDVKNFADQCRNGSWRTSSMPPSPVSREIVDELTDLGVFGEDDSKVNSVFKTRLYPTKHQKAKLEQMFAANRAVYNKLVGMSKIDRATRLTARDKSTKMSLAQLGKKYRPIAQLGTMNKYFRNKKGLARHREVHDEVRGSAYRDFLSATKSSIAGFFAKLNRDESTSYPDMRFKSKFDLSNTIEILTRSIKVIQKQNLNLLRFHPKFFGFGKQDGIEVCERVPVLTMAVRLQRLREGTYYIIVPQKREFTRSDTTRVCAIDPGIRHFATLYDPDGRTLSVTDSRSVLKKKFEAIDSMKSTLANMDTESKARHPDKVRTKRKRGKCHPKTKQHRQRYRLRRCIRLTSRKATRVVTDMHQKLASWLSANYYNVLLPTFQTSQMVQKHLMDAASDATPRSCSDEERVKIQKRKMSSPTARAMMAQAHYRFKKLLRYKMARAGGRLIDCEEEYTSKTCSSCGEIKHNLGGNHVFRCASCHAVFDRDLSAAKNIFHKNMSLLG